MNSSPMEITQLMGLLQKSGNPMQALQGLAANNPAMRQAMSMASGGDPRQVVLNLAKERGIDMAQLQQMAGQLGLQL